MHARVLRVQVQPGKVDEAIQLYEGVIATAAREQPGFRGLLLLVDRHAGTAISISTWETEADMIASEATGYLQEQLAKLSHVFVPDLLPGRETYEVGAQLS